MKLPIILDKVFLIKRKGTYLQKSHLINHFTPEIHKAMMFKTGHEAKGSEYLTLKDVEIVGVVMMETEIYQ